MKKITASDISTTVRELFIEAGRLLPDDVARSFDNALEREESPLGRTVLSQLVENARLAESEGLALCQDTGFAVVFIEWGEKVAFDGDDLRAAVNDGVRRAYADAFYRKSIVNDPVFDRKNTGDNTPAVIHFDIVPGDKVRIVAAPKGGGSENMSAIRMLKPADGLEGVKKFVIETVTNAGGNPCPPVIVGIGIGGTMETAALLAKKALLRELGSSNSDERYAALERSLLDEINATGIGPMGFGGRTTALGVHAEYHPCHIASMPVAVNMQCHSARHRERIL